MIYNNILDRIGNTPIVQFDTYRDAEIFLKLEGFNPTGSLKDRSALSIVRKLESQDKLTGKTLLDASSGSFACALAYIGKIMDIPVTVVVNSKISKNNLAFLEIFGAKIIRHGDVTGDGYEYCLDLVKKHPSKYAFTDQLNNWASPEAHYTTTGPEILEDMLDVDFVVASMGSGSTLNGVGRYLRDHGSNAKMITAVAKPGKKIAGTYSKGPDYISPFMEQLWKENMLFYESPVSYTEAIERCLELRQKGIFVGPQGGGVLQAAMVAIDENNLNGKFVLIMGDSGFKNLDKLIAG